MTKKTTSQVLELTPSSAWSSYRRPIACGACCIIRVRNTKQLGCLMLHNLAGNVQLCNQYSLRDLLLLPPCAETAIESHNIRRVSMS